MKQKLVMLTIMCCWSFLGLFSQNTDPILFELGDQQVKLSEFEYIYNKNNGQGADYSRESLEEYLDLYIRFKMKVQKARDLQMDTIEALSTELAGYRRQLASSYLTDKEVIDRLCRQLYERQQEDVHISHILIAGDDNIAELDTMEMYKKAMEVYQKLEKGIPFDTLVRKYSEDEYTKDQNGTLGYLNAKLPAGFYFVENAIYNTPVGSYSKPVRSKMGYHIIKVNEKRPARGEIEVAHILVRKSQKGKEDMVAKDKIDQIYGQIKRGADFETTARRDSEDKNTSKNGGYIGFFGINQLESAFENAAFALEQDGSISEPIETSIGWHIIKRISKRPSVPFEKQRRKLQEEIKNDERYEIAQKSMIQRIKNQAGFRENKALLDKLASMLDDQFYSIKWETPNDIPNDTLFVLDEAVFMLPGFVQFARQNTRTRLRLSKETPIREALGMLYEEYVNSACISYEEANLEEKYPDFRALMREYEEGILLFEATKLHVWDRASSDTTGLKSFFEKNRDRYMWDERAEIISVNISGVSEKKAQKIKSYITRKGIEKAVSKYNKKQPIVTFSRKKVEKRTARDYEPMAFEKGAESAWSSDSDSNYSYKYIAEIHPPQKKTMDEARGYIIADYQDELEKNWIAELQRTYPVEINVSVFESLIQE